MFATAIFAREPEADTAENVHSSAPILVRDQKGSVQLFTAPLEPGGGVGFGSIRRPIEVFFEGGSPFVYEQNPFEVNPGSPISQTVRPGVSGLRVFSIRAKDESFKFTGLQLEIAEKLTGVELYCVGFQVAVSSDAEEGPEELVLQVYTKPGNQSLHASFANQTSSAQVLRVQKTGHEPEPMPLEAGEVKGDAFEPTGLGSALRVKLLETKAQPPGPNEDANGGAKQADIIVEPPP